MGSIFKETEIIESKEIITNERKSQKIGEAEIQELLKNKTSSSKV